jgi:peptidylprolyl isomerase
LFFIQTKGELMEKVKEGRFVLVDYTGTLDNGEVFDSSEGRQPLEVQMGTGSVIPGFETALRGMSLNETKNVTIAPEEAYGHRDESRKHNFPKSDIPEGIEPQVGQTLMLSSPQGQQIPARVSSVEGDHVTFDLNHPLAGQALTFKLQVVGISDVATQPKAGCASGCSGGDCDCGDGGCC